MPSSHALVRDGRAPSFLAIEIGAQAAAAFEVLRRLDRGGDVEPMDGRLVRVRGARIRRADVAADSPIRVVARQVGIMPPLAIYQIEAADTEGPVLDGIISTWCGNPAGPRTAPLRTALLMG